MGIATTKNQLSNWDKNSPQYEEFSNYVVVQCPNRDVFQSLLTPERLNKLVRKYEDKKYIEIYEGEELGLTIQVDTYEEF